MVVLEAIATGIPVVATAVGGTPEVIRDHREGILVEPSSAAALTRGIELFLDKEVDYNAISSAALRRHDSQYSAKSMARNMASVYDSILQTEN
jgi:glycosyltransferase involved in cell wall biosynthesis